MEHFNIELKARTARQSDIRSWLQENGADYRGLDEQIDTYFHLSDGNGRLKLRQGNIETNLIHYKRSDAAEARSSEVALAAVADGPALKNCLARALGVLVEVQKRREIYFKENVKIHLDDLEGLGQFVEIEAIAPSADFPKEKLREQCQFYIEIFGIRPEDILADSYSDMLLTKGK